MLQTLNCIRMGEVLLDENQQLFILCNNCHTDVRNLQDFRQHLEKCEGLENLFQKGQQHFKYNCDKSTQLFGKTLKGIKEFLIYDYNDVEVSYAKTEENYIDLINIEEELLDPKWYSDLNSNEVGNNNGNSSAQKSSKQYDELVEAVTPFVQFKENLKSNNNGEKSSTEIKVNSQSSEKCLKNVKFDLSDNKVKPAAKRKLSLTKAVPIHIAVPSLPTPAQLNVASNTLLNSATTTVPISKIAKTYNAKKRKIETNNPNGFVNPPEINKSTKITTILPPASIATNIVLNPMTSKSTSTTTTTTIVSNSILKPEPTKEKQTAQILNKLQNLGLQVKRTQPLPPPKLNETAATHKTDNKTLEILQKLQSKGMKVKILNKQQTTTTNEKAKPLPVLISNPAQKSHSVIRNPAANMAIKQNLNKNLIIRKVN